MLNVCFIFFFYFLFLSLLSFSLSIFFMMSDLMIILELELLTINSSMVVMSILFDWMSLLFMSFVMFISSMVIFYSKEYMSGDMMINRFIMLVFMFVISMMLLIVSPNLISILLGWDGLGLVSYCLVIYYQNIKSYNAGMLTALSNRIGDVALLMSISWMLNYGSWNYVFYLECMKDDFSMQLISYLVILASMTKSAQIPFSSWLPAAMAAPTPVSSLVHSSTLVTAGVYLLIRFNYSLSISMMNFLLIFSLLTMFMAGLVANFEFDLKKIIALSTLSQLGLMMSILSLGGSMLAFFHLLTHALFKALLFMCAGCMIHNLMNCQDIRFMGSLFFQMPLTCSLFNISNLSLCGIPFLSGFYSKDLILEVYSMGYMNMFVFLIFFFSTGLTVCYSFRLMYYTLFSEFNFSSIFYINDYGKIMLKGMVGLIFFVIFMGSFLMWMIFPTPVFICLPVFLKFMTLFVSMSGFWLGLECSKFSIGMNSFSKNFINLSFFFSSLWNMGYISTLGVTFYPLHFSSLTIKSLDYGWSEYIGGQNFYKNLVGFSKFMTIYYNNNFKIYFILMILWMVVLIVCLI
uniref:NADH-ubiquinone oxidoreductase chain 5 n=1 Tax=Byrrhus sp. MJTNT-2012 TaxID=1131599 RepID=H6W8L6_9COLE|nr:NADH dehydrogenase subunit 5 [Byrrhus sp. MJTNT-2012]